MMSEDVNLNYEKVLFKMDRFKDEEHHILSVCPSLLYIGMWNSFLATGQKQEALRLGVS